MSNKIQGGSNTAGQMNVDSFYQARVGTEPSVSTNPEAVGAFRLFVENDEGTVTGNTALISPEADVDYRLRVSQDLHLDEEVFNYTAQNTGKHYYGNTTMTNVWTAGQLTTNGSSITTTTTGTVFKTRAMFPTTGTCTLSGDFELAFSAQPVANTLIDFGFFLQSDANPFAPTDGAFFRLNASGLQGVVANSGTETSTGVFPLADGTGTWVYTNDKKYQFIVYLGGVQADFWVNDGSGAVKLGSVPLPSGQNRMTMASSLPLALRHAIVGGAAGGVIQAKLGAYNVRQGGVQYATSPSIAGNRMFGSYQGLSGGTMGSLASYTNNANPTAAVPTNTTSTVLTALGGQGWETDTLAVNTDGIIMSYQVPAGTANVQGKRLVLRGLKIDTFVQTAQTGGGYNEIWTLNWGHTAVSLATAEAATTKARRVLPIGVRAVPAATAALTKLETITLDLGDAPIYVNPGEFIAVAKKKVGTAPSAGVMAHTITPIYGWE
jgi:hypothetical protein